MHLVCHIPILFFPTHIAVCPKFIIYKNDFKNISVSYLKILLNKVGKNVYSVLRVLNSRKQTIDPKTITDWIPIHSIPLDNITSGEPTGNIQNQ